jgi:hypothetical protein
VPLVADRSEWHTPQAASFTGHLVRPWAARR